MNILLPIKFSMDSMVLNAIADGVDLNIKRIFHLIKEHDLWYCFIIPYSVQEEIDHINTPRNVKECAYYFLRTEKVELNAEEKEQWLRLFSYAKGESKKNNVLSDLQNIAEAAKYGNYFITLDEKLLKKREKIKEIFPQLTLGKPADTLKKLQESLASIAPMLPSFLR